MTLQQYQTTLNQLTANPPAGRVAIRISSNIDRWKNTSADVEVRAGDVLVIPKKPSYVMVSGQVFNPTAISYRPGKSAKWYLSQSGGPTQLANKKAIFVIRADGSVIGGETELLDWRFVQCGAAAGGYGGCAGEGDRRRPELECFVHLGAGCFGHRKHGIYRHALLGPRKEEG